MFNFLDKIREAPAFYRQLALDRQLITEFNCPLESKKETIWTDQSYFVYVLEGTKIWHIPDKAFELKQGQCLFVKKGAHIIEQVFDTTFCLIVFFISDNFIANTLGNHQLQEPVSANGSMPVISYIHTDNSLHAFFNSIATYFMDYQKVNTDLLELKFRELILNVINDPHNKEVTSYFHSLTANNHGETMRKILEENFQYNLRIENYARLCGRSLSAFKRDFETYFKTTPGKWLLARRLQHARILIHTSEKSISEIAFESGFENSSHFSRAFKQYYGYPPTDARRIQHDLLSKDFELSGNLR
ncbi:MAG: AraC family transcriptional regulator [Bacteroidota bacterium]